MSSSKQSSSNVLVIESNFYRNISEISLSATKEMLRSLGITFDHISVPGSFDIANAMNIALENVNYDGVVVLGCVIRGETFHFELVSHESARSINEVAIHYSMPLGFGIITVDNMQQAEARAADYAKRAVMACIQLMGIKSEFTSVESGEAETPPHN